MSEEQLSEIFEYYAALPDAKRQENLVAMLREIQDVLGCVPDGVTAQAAWVHRVTVCTGPRCAAKGGADVYKALRDTLRPGPDGVSENGRVLLCTQNCLKQCRTSPNVLVDGVLHPNMTGESAQKLAQKLMTE